MNIKNKLVFFQANTQYENTGDVLINKSLLDHLKRYADIVVNDTGMPGWYVEQLGVKKSERISTIGRSFQGFLILSAFKSFFRRNRFRVYIIAGPPGHQSGNSSKKAVRNIVSGVLFSILQILGVRIIKIGFSLGPIGPYIAFAEKFRSIFTDYYYIRDSISLRLAKSIGIKKATFFPDLAWTYQPAIPQLDSVHSGPKSTILLSFRDAVGKGHQDAAYLNRIQSILETFVAQYQDKYTFSVVYQVEMDREFCQLLYDRLAEKYSVNFVDEQITLESAARFYSNVECILTNRLHGALLAYKYGALPLILTDIGSHTKITGIYSDAGLSHLLLNTSNDTNSILSQLSDLLLNRATVYHTIQNAEKEYRELSDQLVHQIFK